MSASSRVASALFSPSRHGHLWIFASIIKLSLGKKIEKETHPISHIPCILQKHSISRVAMGSRTAGSRMGRACVAACAAMPAVSDMMPSAVSKLIPSVVVDSASGCTVTATDGRQYLDFASGIGTLSTGHCHPRVVSAVQEQAGKCIMAQQNVFGTHTAQVRLLERLHGIMPEGLTQYLFCNSGAEAVDNAIKVARAATGKPNIICFDGSFHGRTYGAMSVTTSKNIYRQNFSPMMPGVVVAPWPNCLHCRVREASGGSGYRKEPYIDPWGNYMSRNCCDSALESLRWVLKTHSHPSETAAVLIEPILGEGGFLIPPPSFLPGLREICDEHGLLLIMDEVQSGVGRTGRWWGHEHVGPGVKPDMLLTAKGLGSGLPIAAVASTPEIFGKLQPGMLGGTYGGNAVACAAADATLAVIEEEGLLANAAARGEQLMSGLVELSRDFPVTDVRGRGLMVAMELGGPNGERDGARPGIAAQISAEALNHGLLILTAGARETVRFLPPLVVSAEEVEQALEAVKNTFKTVYG